MEEADELRCKCEELWNMRKGIDDHEILELIDELYEKMWNRSNNLEPKMFRWQPKEEVSVFRIIWNKLTCKPEIETIF